MNWNEIGTQVILAIVGVITTGLGALITVLINKYVKDSKIKTMLLSLNEVVKTVVNEVNQTYVEALKKDGCFNEECQKKALETAIEKIKTDLPSEVLEWVKSNYSDIDTYLKGLVESTIYSLKK